VSTSPRPNGQEQSFHGDLRLIGLFDLGQLLMLNRATGRLVVERDGRRGYLFFRDGRIVNAIDDDQAEGEKAAYRIFAWKNGSFEFRPEPVRGAELIQESTEAIMLEAARLIDESTEAAGEAVASEAARLLDRQSELEALREVFHRVAREARSVDRSEPSPSAWLVDALLDADDLLLCRASERPRLLQDGRWRFASEETMSDEEYDALKLRLLGTGKPPAEGEVARSPRSEVVRFDDGRAFLVVVHGPVSNETLCVRPLGLSPPDPDLLDGAPGSLLALLDPPQALLLAGAPTAAAADRLLHALAPLVAQRRSGATVLVADLAAYAHGSDAVILQTTPADAPALLAAVPIANLLLGATSVPTAALLPWIARTPFVAAAVVATDATSVVARWRAALSLAGATPALALDGLPIGILFTEGPSLGDGRMPFTARTHSPEESHPALDPSELGWHPR
jgi:hypothetical protein